MTNTFRASMAALLIASGISAGMVSFPLKKNNAPLKQVVVSCVRPASSGCVFKTLLGRENFDTGILVKNRAMVTAALRHGLEWMAAAQSASGGWGSGSHYNQQQMDPHAVEADPATTSLVCMAIMRNKQGEMNSSHAEQFDRALGYLLRAVEQAPDNASNITAMADRQPQVKLGRNIDVILCAQFLTNYLQQAAAGVPKKERVEKALRKCVAMIQRGQDKDGGWKDGGWAPVLQSALANNALETAKDAGIPVNNAVLEKSKHYQEQNFDATTHGAITGKAAGVLLYSISGSARASAKEARLAEAAIHAAKQKGRLRVTDSVTRENLVVAGMSGPEADKYITAYAINKAASKRAQDRDVITGFGSNGGEEFLSYLMTGESLLVSHSSDWQQWYNQTSARLLQIQNQDGSWNGHHCITSPVFCTATCLLILSIDKDMDFLMQLK